MADMWDPAAFGLTPAAPVAQAPASPTAAPQQTAQPSDTSAWAPSQFGLVPQQQAATVQPQDASLDVPQPRLNPAQRMRANMATPEEADAIVAGKNRALKDVIDRPAEWLAGLFGSGDQVAQQDTADRQAYDAQYANNPAAEASRVGGQAALTLPLMGAGGQIVGAGGDLLAAGVGKVAPVAGSLVDRAATFLGGDAGGTGGLVSRGLQGASVLTNEGLKGAAAAGLTSGQSGAPVAQQMLNGAEVGAGAGGLTRGAGGVIGGVGNAVSGGEVSPALADLAQTARDKYGINLTADMISPSPFLRTLGSQAQQVPLSGMAAAKGALQGQFTKAVAGTFGEDADQITPAVMQAAKQRIGGVMNDVAANTGVTVDQPFADHLQQIATDSLGSMPLSERPMLQKQMSDILDMASQNGGAIPGSGYQTLTNFRSPIATSMRAGTPTMQDFSGRLKDAMDDALERTAVANGNADSIAALQQAKSQYKALKTVEPLVTKGEPGEITPNLLRGRVDQSYKGRALRADQPDLGELADIGQRFKLTPDSGTAGRTAAYAAMGAIGGAGTQLAAGQPLNALMTAGAIPAAMVGARAATSYLTNPNVINRMLQAAPSAPSAGLNSLLPYAAPSAEILKRNILSQ